jgi:transposase
VLTHSIINLLGIKDKHVEIFDSGEEQGVFWFELHTRVKMQKCPKCKSRTKRASIAIECKKYRVH